ncbi:MAG: hypothetical protein B9S32_11385 [Verrucomicrobia bacterium Tous-C9LFEB]|nr:MAG: hypothetical protein B9S32_11385 [Verrucomicrobia bacterium Tous-C9LFEB]
MITPMRFIVFGLLLATVCVLAEEKGGYTTTEFTWHDNARNRDVPALIYAPTTGTGPFPVLFFSHGLGGSRHGYSYLGEYWSTHGFISVHVQHPGSDESLVKSGGGPRQVIQAMKEATTDVDNLVNRPKDISFAIDQVTALNTADGAWKGKFDLAKIGVAGHSFGAYTTMAVVGLSFRDKTLVDPRVKAVVAMSTPANATTGTRVNSYANVHVPALHITGTEDTSFIRPEDTAEFRRKPYDLSPGPDTYLIIFKGADHMVFGGNRQRRMPGKGENDAPTQKRVCEVTTAFWNAYLKDDASAKQWLTQGGLAQALGSTATLEKK